MTAYDDCEGKLMQGKARQARYSIGWESIVESPSHQTTFLYLYPVSGHIYVWVTITKKHISQQWSRNIDNSGTKDLSACICVPGHQPAKFTPKLRTSGATTRQLSVTILEICSSLPSCPTPIYIERAERNHTPKQTTPLHEVLLYKVCQNDVHYQNICIPCRPL
jgi:hypothetical protein